VRLSLDLRARPKPRLAPSTRLLRSHDLVASWRNGKLVLHSLTAEGRSPRRSCWTGRWRRARDQPLDTVSSQAFKGIRRAREARLAGQAPSLARDRLACRRGCRIRGRRARRGLHSPHRLRDRLVYRVGRGLHPPTALRRFPRSLGERRAAAMAIKTTAAPQVLRRVDDHRRRAVKAVD
jgi:hypothetical protein